MSLSRRLLHLRLQPTPRRARLLSAPLPLPAAASTHARFYRVSSAPDDVPRGRRGPGGSSNNSSSRALGQLVLALRTFHALESHFAVPFGFVVPRSEAWPHELHALPLGVKVHRFMQSLAKGSEQKQRQAAEQLHELRALGFPLHSWQEYQFQQVCLPALRCYAQQYGDLFVPQKFVVPAGDDEDEAQLWPRATRGFKLGLAVAKLRKQVQQQRQREQQLKDKKKQATTSTSSTAALPPLPKSQVDALNALGFVWRVRDTKWYQFFLPGLRRYRELHGNADVPLAFTIPPHEEDPRWPKALEGYMLGRHVYMVRSGKYATQVRDSKQELDELGFSFRLVDKVWGESIFPALEVFSAQYGHCDVWQDFVVPSGAPWPKDSWALKLGDTVKNIRRGAYDAQVQAARKELDKLGFVWNARHRVEKTVRSIVIPALTTYRRLHGNDALVTTDFVVPERDPSWPVLTRGFRLGQWITRVRSGQVVLPSKLRAELDKSCTAALAHR
ncbi:Formin protein 20 [Phytophthora cinnamomi]|uniref:Formin protein 20 n=1 Tax=Phytophthora cinnamomi TaxID=4785 RepID=UPI00355A1DA4|nr:Formin protein 20 [Phytophthora cinnamomi]